MDIQIIEALYWVMEYPILNLPRFKATIRSEKGKEEIFDVFRKKYVSLTPEEWVRQHLAHFLVNNRGYPRGLMALEREVTQYGFRKRFDLVAYKPDMQPVLLVECKAPQVGLDQNVLDQILGYHQNIPANTLLISNGKQHYCFRLDNPNNKWLPLSDIPYFQSL